MAGTGSIRALGSWVAVFAVGFAVGYGLMALMVDSPGSAEPTAVAAASVEESAAVKAPAAPEPAIPAVGQEVQADSEAAAPMVEGAPGATAAPAGGAQAPGDAPETPPAEKLVEPASDEAPDGAAAAAEPKAEAWWDKCRGQTCRVDWGGLTGGISVRKGTLTHRAAVDWERDFAHTARRGVIPTAKDTRLQLLAVGLDHAGQPAAASVVWANGGQRLQGVISLAPGDKRITLKSIGP